MALSRCHPPPTPPLRNPNGLYSATTSLNLPHPQQTANFSTVPSCSPGGWGGSWTGGRGEQGWGGALGEWAEPRVFPISPCARSSGAGKASEGGGARPRFPALGRPSSLPSPRHFVPAQRLGLVALFSRHQSGLVRDVTPTFPGVPAAPTVSPHESRAP